MISLNAPAAKSMAERTPALVAWLDLDQVGDSDYVRKILGDRKFNNIYYLGHEGSDSMFGNAQTASYFAPKSQLSVALAQHLAQGGALYLGACHSESFATPNLISAYKQTFPEAAIYTNLGFGHLSTAYANNTVSLMDGFELPFVKY